MLRCERVGNPYNKEEFEKVTKPVVEWMQKNCTPHDTIRIDIGGVELMSGEMAYSVKVPD